MYEEEWGVCICEVSGAYRHWGYSNQKRVESATVWGLCMWGEGAGSVGAPYSPPLMGPIASTFVGVFGSPVWIDIIYYHSVRFSRDVFLRPWERWLDAGRWWVCLSRGSESRG